MANQSMPQSWLRRIIIALAGANTGNGVASMIENGNALALQSGVSHPLAVVATSVSTTVNFGSLQVGDLLVHIPAAAGNSSFETVVTAGTKPSAAVIGDLYVAIRGFSIPPAHNFKL